MNTFALGGGLAFTSQSKTGETFDYQRLRLTIVAAGARSVKRGRIEKLPDEEKQNP